MKLSYCMMTSSCGNMYDDIKIVNARPVQFDQRVGIGTSCCNVINPCFAQRADTTDTH